MIEKVKEYYVLGIMSGTSLDGLDLAYCYFEYNKVWKFKIIKSTTIKYSNYWKNTLAKTHLKDNYEIKEIDKKFGIFIANEANKFIKKKKINFISCHGHTIFHEPNKKINLQIGNGKTIAEITNKTVINDFRTLDISLNGEGAPLVPIGDLYLFKKYKYCVNLGGFANISIKQNNSIVAFDICPVNIILNHISNKLGKEYDKNGRIAKKGVLINKLFKDLNNIIFYKNKPPKSLSREWVEKEVLKLINNKMKLNDVLHTLCEHIAFQIGNLLKCSTTLITGGGVFNNYLIDRIKYHSTSKIIIPNNEIINSKEALIFGFLGVLKIRNEINCLKSVTGARKNSCGGIIHTP